jgi:signal transduction histidine kinase
MERLRQNEAELASQRISLTRQGGTIRIQERLIFGTLGVLALFLILAFRFYFVHQSRKRKELEEYSLLLEQTISERTREIQSMTDKLVRQEKLAAIGQVSASVAHELRNPLSAINQAVFFIKRKVEPSSGRVKTSLELIEREIISADRVISDLLEITQVKAPKRERVNLREMALDAAHRCALDDGIQLILEIEPDPFWLWVDPLQIRQVLMNLFVNAAQACSGNGTITLKALCVAEQGGDAASWAVDWDGCDYRCEIQVQDDGCGVDKESIEHAFELLYTTKAKGTGLGLSICRQIVEKHHGSISLESPFDRGTTVKISLPSPASPENSDCFGAEK